MRNLKRALSLALASVMLLGMMVVGTSAASYPDVDEKDNIEAIEVLNAAKVMIGEQGNFNPDAKVNRHAMAVIMAKLYLGVDTADNYVGSHPFTDVVPWADKYVAACYENGLVVGTSATTYGGNNPLTAVQAAAMMLRALGYKDLSKGADNWSIPVTAKANEIRLFNGVASNPKEELTRNQVAQLALNTLKSPMVTTVDGTFDVTSGQGGVIISGGSLEYKVRFSREAYAYAINKTENSGNSASGVQGATIELGEHLYNGKLKLNDDARDDFGRPARKWEYDGKAIGTYAKTELLRAEYTTEVTGKTLYELLGSEVISSITRGGTGEYRLAVTIDGETTRPVLGTAYFTEQSMTRTNNNKVGETGKGVLTQVFVDGVNKKVDIAIINTYLAQATRNYSSANDNTTLKVYKLDAVGGGWVKGADDTNRDVNGDDFAIKDVKKDDFFLVTVANGDIKTMVKPEVLSEVTLNAFKQNSWVKTADAQYDHASTARYDVDVLDNYSQTNMKDVTYNIFLDKNGYLVGLEQNEAVNQYLFLTGMDLGSSNLGATETKANVIFIDGTMKTITVNLKKSMPINKVDANGDLNVGGTLTSKEGGDWRENGSGTAWSAFGDAGTREYSQLNTWCTYTVDADGVYTLKEVGANSQVAKGAPVTVRKVGQKAMNAATDIKINTKNVTLDGNAGDYAKVYGNDQTVYINVKLTDILNKDAKYTKIVDKVDSTTVGIKNTDFTVDNIAGDTNNGVGLAASRAPANEVYTLYNKDGYIIAAVTLDAEDNGATASYAYIVGDVNQEEYLGNSKWRWSQKAIVDGKEVTLTETADAWANLDKTVKGKWYELSYNADGEVASIKSSPAMADKSIDFANTANSKAPDQYLSDVREVDPALNGAAVAGGNPVVDDGVVAAGTYPSDKTLLLYADYTGTDADMRYENGTLYTNYTTKEGFWVSPNVKVVLCLSKMYDSSPFHKIYDSTTYSTREGLEDALAALNSDKKEFHGYLSAIFDGKNGATTIILDDRSGAATVTEPMKNMNVTINKVADDGNTWSQAFSWNGSNPLNTTNYPAITTPAGYTSDNTTIAISNFVEGGSDTFTLYFTKDTAEESMLVNITFVDGSGTKVDEAQAEIGAPDSGWVVNFELGVTEDKDGAVIDVPADKIIKNGTSKKATFAFADKTVKDLTFTVVDPVSVTVHENADDATGTVVKYDPDTTIATVAGAVSNGHVFYKYTDNGTDKVVAGTATTKLGDGTDVTDVWKDQYVKLDSQTVACSTKPTASAGTLTVAPTIENGVDTINGADYILVGSDVTIDIKFTHDQAGDVTLSGELAMAVTVTTASGAPVIGTPDPAVLADDNLTIPTGATGKTVSIDVTVTLPADIDTLTKDCDALTLTFAAPSP